MNEEQINAQLNDPQVSTGSKDLYRRALQAMKLLGKTTSSELPAEVQIAIFGWQG